MIETAAAGKKETSLCSNVYCYSSGLEEMKGFIN